MPLITRRKWFVLALCTLLAGFSSVPAWAIVTTSSFNNTTPPSDDPGFYNVGATAGASIIYLGNGWALTAGHVNTSNNNPGNTSNYGTVSFSNGSQNTAYGVANILPWLTGADLKLVNLTTSPNLPSLTISSSFRRLVSSCGT